MTPKDIPPLEPPELLTLYEPPKTPPMIIQDLNEKGKEGFRMIWPATRLEKTYTDFYIAKENGKYFIASQTTTKHCQSHIEDINPELIEDKSKLLNKIYEHTMKKAKNLAMDMRNEVEDQSSYTSRNKEMD